MATWVIFGALILVLGSSPDKNGYKNNYLALGINVLFSLDRLFWSFHHYISNIIEHTSNRFDNKWSLAHNIIFQLFYGFIVY